MTKRRKVARLDRAHLLALVRCLRANVLRLRESKLVLEAKGIHHGAMWDAGACCAYRNAALQICRQLRQQEQDDWRARSRRLLGRSRAAGFSR